MTLVEAACLQAGQFVLCINNYDIEGSGQLTQGKLYRVDPETLHQPGIWVRDDRDQLCGFYPQRFVLPTPAADPFSTAIPARTEPDPWGDSS